MSEDTAIAIDDENVDASTASQESLASIAHVALPMGVSQVDFDMVLSIGRAKGQLTQAEMIEALHAVELTPEVLTELIDRVTAEGVALVADEEEDLAVEVTPRREPRAGRKSGAVPRSAARDQRQARRVQR